MNDTAHEATKDGFDADVVVVGAGFAGMAAAYQLWKHGHSVKVVEAMDRIGGRSYSTTLSDGMFLDIGAGWTGSTEHHILSLVKEFGLNIYTQYGLGEDEGQNLFIGLDGKKKTFDSLNFPVSEDAQLEVLAAIELINCMAETVPLEAPWTARDAVEWDSISAGVFVRNNFKSPEALAVITANLTTIFGLNPYAVSLLHLLWISHTAGGVDKFGSIPEGSAQYRIEGGTQLIPLKMAELVGKSNVVLNSPVSEIHQDEFSATVVSELATFRCRRVVVAIPTCMTGFIRYDPILPADRAQLIQRTPQGSAMKIQMVYDRAFWRDAGLSGNSFAINDTIVPQTLDAGGPAGKGKGKDEPGIMGVFIDDDLSRDLGRLSESERKERILKELVPRFGEQIRHLSEKITPNYFEFTSQDLEWVRGDYASVPGPRVLTASGFGPALRDPFKRIHWSGVDTCTIWYQSIEGATQSGERSADEVMKAGLK